MNQKLTPSEVFSSDYQFNLSDFALFLSVMRNKEAYEAVLSIIMDDSELTLTDVKVEQVILNKSGNRAIRLDAWAMDSDKRQFNTEMENSGDAKEIQKRSRYYQSMMDTPILKSGKNTKYKELPSTIIIFITQTDIFKKDLAMYTFTEQCEEIADLKLEDGTTKIFLNMASNNGRPELVSLLQYMKNTKINDSELSLYDKRIQKLNSIVNEVLDSTEWEAVKSNILEIGMTKGQEIGFEIGLKKGHDEGMAIGLAEGHSKGLAEGHSKGLAEGHSKGLAEGHSKGLAEGHSKGLAEGHSKGLAEGHSKGLAEGHSKGLAEGRAEKLKEQISRKIQKGKSAELIAVELEEELDVILPLYHHIISSSS